ncbi:Piso0_005884 [Millerozyma farinosa CBS 7064]|uniref:Piso0_005884 protein n=1 Tax=Pichia sorbitophila (strain ATCC MYA-4447 / BCRC 22081 / CBS 7064 / NBRC 10061 / NRRL Y-12695) TaxID=559304 RepID=G8Y366_PICSO|nr:Piso0_005884 [Millerozyma farinosa CBS 7064]
MTGSGITTKIYFPNKSLTFAGARTAHSASSSSRQVSYQKLAQISQPRRASRSTFYVANARGHLSVVEYIVQRCKIQNNTPSLRNSSGPWELAGPIRQYEVDK